MGKPEGIEYSTSIPDTLSHRVLAFPIRATLELVRAPIRLLFAYLDRERRNDSLSSGKPQKPPRHKPLLNIFPDGPLTLY